jgi:predicted nucleic acid-binding protein
MNDLGINSVMLDTSFCIRLMDDTEALHINAMEYYRYFLQEKITMHISTIAVAEYAVGDDPQNLPLNTIQIEAFDFLDAKEAGNFHKFLKGTQTNIEGYNRRIIVNDLKIFAQLKTKKLDAIISADANSAKKYITPLTTGAKLNVKFIDLNIRLQGVRGLLF